MPAALPIAMGASAIASAGSAAMGASAAGNAAETQAGAAKYAADLQKSVYDQSRADTQPWRQAGLSAMYGPGGLFTRTDGGSGIAMDSKTGQNKYLQDRFGELTKARDQAVGQIHGPMADDLKSQIMGKMSDDTLRQQAQSDWNSIGSKDPNYGPQINSSAYQLDPSLTKSFSMEDFQADPGYQFRMDQGQQALERSAAARGGLMSGGTLKAITDYGQNFASNEFGNAYNRFTNNQTNRFNRLASIAGLGQTATAQMNQAGQSYGTNAGNIAVGNANAQGAAGIAQANAWGSGIQGVANAGQNWMNYSLMSKMLPQTAG